MAPLACTVLLHLQDRVEKAQHHFHRGKEPSPRLTCGFPAVGADRACLRVWCESLGCLGTRAIALLHGPRIGRLDHAHPQQTAAADGSRDRALLLRSPRQLLIGHQIAGHLVRVLHGGAEQRRAAAGQPGALPEHGMAAKDRGQGVKGSPPLPQGEGFFDASVRAIMEGMTHEGRRVKTASVVCHVIRRMLRSCLIDTERSCKGKPWSIS